MPNTPDPAELFAASYAPIPLVVKPFGPLTTVDEVRSVFGLSDAELPDDMLTQRVYTRKVASMLNQVDARIGSEWEALKLAHPTLQESVETFALYCVADQICDVLPLVAARTLSDSKATFQRFDMDLQQVIASIRQRFAMSAQALQAVLAATEQTPMKAPVLFGSGRPTYDPVTG